MKTKELLDEFFGLHTNLLYDGDGDADQRGHALISCMIDGVCPLTRGFHCQKYIPRFGTCGEKYRKCSSCVRLTDAKDYSDRCRCRIDYVGSYRRFSQIILQRLGYDTT